MQIINTKPSSISTVPYVDFGWYLQSNNEPGSFLQFTTNSATPSGSYSSNWPPSLTTTTGSVTTPANTTTSFTVPVTSSASFVGGTGSNPAGTNYANGQIGGSVYLWDLPFWALVSYQYISGTTLEGCYVVNGSGGGTNIAFPSGTQVFDPRYTTTVIPISLTSQTVVVFDAVDNLSLGLNKTPNPNQIVQWQWNFGNGQLGYGPTASTIYWYNAAPNQVQVTLKTLDIYGNTQYVSHPVYFSLYSGGGQVVVRSDFVA